MRKEINPRVLVTTWDKNKNKNKLSKKLPDIESNIEEKHIYRCAIRFGWIDFWKRYREKRYTQAAWYRLTGIHTQSIGRFDRGVSSPTVGHVFRLCEYVARTKNRSTMDVMTEYYGDIQKHQTRLENELRDR